MTTSPLFTSIRGPGETNGDGLPLRGDSRNSLIFVLRGMSILRANVRSWLNLTTIFVPLHMQNRPSELRGMLRPFPESRSIGRTISPSTGFFLRTGDPSEGPFHPKCFILE